MCGVRWVVTARFQNIDNVLADVESARAMIAREKFNYLVKRGRSSHVGLRRGRTLATSIKC